MPKRPADHVDDPASVGKRLREARLAAGLSQRDLSFPGCTSAYISRIESGARVPSYQILLKFAQRLGVGADYLATGTQEGVAVRDPLFEAEIALRLGDADAAKGLYEQVRLDSESPAAVARAEIGLAQLAIRNSEISEAVELLEHALSSEHLTPADASIAGSSLGRAYVSQGRFEEALGVFKRFLAEAQERNDQFDVMRFSLLLANTYVDTGNYPPAQEVLGDVLGQARKVVDPMLQAGLYWSQSRLYSSQGQADLAAQYAQMTIATLKASEHTIEAARALLLLAHIENDRGNAETALELVEEGEPVVANAGEAGDEGMFIIERARALDALGQSEEAASLLLGATAKLGDASPTSAARAYAAIASFFRSRGDTARALELYELAAERLNAPDRHLADVLTGMAEIHEDEGRPDKALQLLKAAVQARSGVRSAS
jgi:tetratricopeptide (TPR) repeat protein